MTARSTFEMTLKNAAETERLGHTMAPLLNPGHVVLLSGELGSGKTHLARAIIREKLGTPDEDVPSPTFTLVQTYETGDFEIWHADLYRLNGEDACHELGLTEAFATAISLIEWPDRLGSLAPDDAISVTMKAEGDVRRAVVSGPAPWVAQLETRLEHA